MAKSIKKLTPEVLGVISRLVIAECKVHEPCWVAKIVDGQLERKVYVAFNEAVETLGGTWNKKTKGHVFDHDPSEEIEALLMTGEFKTKFSGDFFQTPTDLAARMVSWAVRPGDLVLEPSAGHGRIAEEIRKVTDRLTCFEVDSGRADRLVLAGFQVVCTDFLKFPVLQRPVDAVVMNPPFSKGQECAHILHAMKFLRPGGRLAAVASGGVTYRQTKPYEDLRRAIYHSDTSPAGNIEELPAGTFSKEGTDVSTVLITWTKP